jgi:hypothetical protein
MTAPRPRTRTEIKHMAQETIMDHVAKMLGYYNPDEYGDTMTEDEREAFTAELRKQADRVARLMGNDEAWTA